MITAFRAAAPNAVILIMVPFSLQYIAVTDTYRVGFIAAMRAAVSAYPTSTPTDGKVKLSDFRLTDSTTIQASGAFYLSASQSSHPNLAGHGLEAPKVTAAIVNALNSAPPLISSVLSTDTVNMSRGGSPIAPTATQLKTYLAGGGS